MWILLVLKEKDIYCFLFQEFLTICKKLSKEQVEELLEYRRKKGNNGANKKREKRLRSSISSVLKSALKDIADEQTKKDEAQAEGKELHDAIVASLKSLSTAKEDKEASVSSLTPATQPKKTGKAEKSVSFAPSGASEVAVTKLIRIMKSLGSGGKPGSQ